MSKGDLPVAFKWLFNGEEIRIHNNLGVVLTTISKKTSILNIESVNAVHRGSYTCEIRNQAGQINHTTVLSVNGSLFSIPFFFLNAFLLLQFLLKFYPSSSVMNPLMLAIRLRFSAL